MKGYPRSQFEIVNTTQIQNIETNPVANNIALYMQPYVSNKGTEDWELLTSFKGFTNTKGGMSFERYGQMQLTVAQALKSGAYVLGKRLVSDDATLANVTVCAKVVKPEGDDTSYLYLFAKTFTGCKTFDEVATEAKKLTDCIPLFTVTPMGRGESSMFIRILPEANVSKIRNSSNYAKYVFEVTENNSVLEEISISINPETIVDGVGQSINPKIKANSKQVRVKMYEDNIYNLVGDLATSTTDIPASDLINLDFINGKDLKGNILPNIITICNSAVNDKPAEDWTNNAPDNAEDFIDLSLDYISIPSGSFGTMAKEGITSTEYDAEIEKLLLNAFGAGDADINDGLNFDPIIYDLDAYKVDCIFDCNWPVAVKQAVSELVAYRGDMVYLADLGTTATTLAAIEAAADEVSVKDDENTIYSNTTFLYHNFFNIIDPFSKKEITVTMPYMLIDKMTNHIAKGVNYPFAGIANNITFDNIVEGSINFMPVTIPTLDQKQKLVDKNVNYISMYDGVPVMETMYANTDTHSQLSYMHNIMAVQEIIKVIRTRCPHTRYTFLDGDDLESYISDVQAIVKEYSSNFRSISCEYMADEQFERNNIFYAVLKVQFKNFIQEEYFKIIAIS
jgi:hypothetical protein